MHKKNVYLFGGILAIYLVIALWYAGNQGYWHDEIFTLTFMKGISAYNFEGSTINELDWGVQIKTLQEIYQQDTFFENFPLLIMHEGHPPLYYIALKIWSLGFGHTELSLRGFSILCGLLILIVAFNIAREKIENQTLFWCVMLFIVFNPFLFYFFAEARMYAFALLMAVLSFRFWLTYTKTGTVRSFAFVGFCISSALLLYSHYYGVFFLTTLVLWDVFKRGFSLKILYYAIPFLLFIPWAVIIPKQLGFHDVHWTDGALSFFPSLIGFVKGIGHLLISPVSEMKLYEQIILAAIVFVALFYLLKEGKALWIYLTLFIGYCLQVYLFDQFFDHHSIIVPRYYIFILSIFYWFIAVAFKKMPRQLMVGITLVYCVLAGIVFKEILMKERAIKQMNREMANYIDVSFAPENTIIVVEPEGPVTWAIAYYIKKNFTIVSAEHYKPVEGMSPVYVDERIGFEFEEDKLNNEEQKGMKLIPFVGIFLYHY